jgi:endoglycosylceramidase
MRLVLALILLTSCAQPRQAPNFDACETVAPEAPTPSPASLHADGAFFKDTAGRTVLLRGVNVAGDSKLPPFATITSAEQLDPLVTWGLNTVRLLFTWEAFEPRPCEYDEEYLRYIERVTSWAEDRGLYVIIDFHQDAFSRFSMNGCGEGFPEWAILSSIATYAPDNGKRCETWGIMMTFDSVTLDTWTAFHRDLEGARTRYLAMVSRVAARMSSHRNVIGYDVMNEPWGQEYELHDLFEDLGATIRKSDPDRILFVPSHPLGQNAPRVSHSNISHSPHFYESGVYLSRAWSGNDLTPLLDRLKDTADEWASPMLLGEFGSNAGIGRGAEYHEAIYTWLDERFVSGTQWNYTPGWTPTRKDGFNEEDFSISDDTGTLRSDLFHPRPYPQKTAGTPLSFRREKEPNGFTYRWNHEPSLGATEFFVLEGHQVAEQSGVPLSCIRLGQRLSCTSPESGEATLTVRE